MTEDETRELATRCHEENSEIEKYERSIWPFFVGGIFLLMMFYNANEVDAIKGLAALVAWGFYLVYRQAAVVNKRLALTNKILLSSVGHDRSKIVDDLSELMGSAKSVAKRIEDNFPTKEERLEAEQRSRFG